MNFVKYFVLVMLSLMATVLTLAALKSPDYAVKRSITINAPRAAVWNQISRWKQFNNWNPWAVRDTNAVYTYAGTDGSKGSSISWKGNSNMGSGSMRTWRIEPMKSVGAELLFTEPWESQSNILITMDGSDGNVQVSWSMEGTQSLLERSFTLFLGGMDQMVGKDYEQGLINLKKVCEAGETVALPQESAPVAKEQGTSIFEWNLPAQKYAGIRNVVTSAQLEDGTFLKQTVLQLMAEIARNEWRVNGSVFVFHYMSDAASGMMDLAVCLPVSIPQGTTAGGRLYVFDLPQRKALAAEQTGWHARGGPARRALSEYVAKKGIQTETFTAEEYLFDPTAGKNPEAVKTRQYVLLP